MLLGEQFFVGQPLVARQEVRPERLHHPQVVVRVVAPPLQLRTVFGEVCRICPRTHVREDLRRGSPATPLLPAVRERAPVRLSG